MTMISFVNEVEAKALDILKEAENVNRKSPFYETYGGLEQGGHFHIRVGYIKRPCILHFYHDPFNHAYFCDFESSLIPLCHATMFFDFEDEEDDIKILQIGRYNEFEEITPEQFLKEMDKLLKAIPYRNI